MAPLPVQRTARAAVSHREQPSAAAAACSTTAPWELLLQLLLAAAEEVEHVLVGNEAAEEAPLFSKCTEGTNTPRLRAWATTAATRPNCTRDRAGAPPGVAHVGADALEGHGEPVPQPSLQPAPPHTMPLWTLCSRGARRPSRGSARRRRRCPP